MSDPKGFLNQREPVRSDLDFDVVAIDLSWNESFGDPVFGGTQAAQGATWEDAFDVQFYRVDHANPSQSGDPGAGEKGASKFPIATSSKRGGAKSAQGGVVNARLLARLADWFARLTVKVTMRHDWSWGSTDQAIAFHAPEQLQFVEGRQRRPDIGLLEPKEFNDLLAKPYWLKCRADYADTRPVSPVMESAP